MTTRAILLLPSMAAGMRKYLIAPRRASLAVLLPLGAMALALACGGADQTSIYVSQLDLDSYLRRGASYTSPEFSPLRIGKPIEQIDKLWDYDFKQLARVEQRLRGVNRRAALRALFAKVNRGALSDTERHLRTLCFLQNAMQHPRLLPCYPPPGDPQHAKLVMDPLVLLELGEGKCGQVARLAIDLFDAAGYPARFVQLGGHQIAEVHYDGQWHYFDADTFKGGQVVLNSDGSVPSVQELSRDPHRIDMLAPYFEPRWNNNRPASSRPYPSYNYFYRAAYVEINGSDMTYLFHKQGTYRQHQRSRYYGWEHLSATLHDFQLLEGEPFYFPGAPALRHVDVQQSAQGKKLVQLEWVDSADQDGDLLGYRVHVSRQSRGWNYEGRSLPAHLMPFKSGSRPWHYSMYSNRFAVPSSEVALLESATNRIEIELDQVGEFYITIMPFDAHGERAGKRLYPMSEEILIR